MPQGVELFFKLCNYKFLMSSDKPIIKIRIIKAQEFTKAFQDAVLWSLIFEDSLKYILKANKTIETSINTNP